MNRRSNIQIYSYHCDFLGIISSFCVLSIDNFQVPAIARGICIYFAGFALLLQIAEFFEPIGNSDSAIDKFVRNNNNMFFRLEEESWIFHAAQLILSFTTKVFYLHQSCTDALFFESVFFFRQLVKNFMKYVSTAEHSEARLTYENSIHAYNFVFHI